MAEKPVSDKTEPATPKRREEAREKGNVARSAEMNSAVVLLMGITALYFITGGVFNQITEFMRHTYLQIGRLDNTPELLSTQVGVMFSLMTHVILPVLLLVLIGGLLSNVVQVGVNFASKALIPSFSKINPGSGFKRMFSARSMVELLKGLLKLAIVGWISYVVIRKHTDAFLMLANQTVGHALVLFGKVIWELSLKSGLALAVCLYKI